MPQSIGHMKNALRRQLRFDRAAASTDVRRQADARIAQHLFALPEYQAARVLMSYCSFGSEVNTHPIIENAWGAGKKVVTPRCAPQKRQMEWYEISSFDELAKSCMGMKEPKPIPERRYIVEANASDRPIALVPGIAFDSRGHRLGYGGGFYDTFLAQFNGLSIGLCREDQMLEQIEFLEAHDIPVDILITNCQVVRISASSNLTQRELSLRPSPQ